MKPSRLQLRGHIAYDIDSAAESKLPTSVLDLSTWDPPNRQSVAVGLQLDIGWDDDFGTDVFSTCFATDDVALSVKVRNFIRLPYFDWDELQQRLLTILERCERENWKESVRQLRKQLDWEFDGMAAYERWLREPRDWP